MQSARPRHRTRRGTRRVRSSHCSTSDSLTRAHPQGRRSRARRAPRPGTTSVVRRRRHARLAERSSEARPEGCPLVINFSQSGESGTKRGEMSSAPRPGAGVSTGAGPSLDRPRFCTRLATAADWCAQAVLTSSRRTPAGNRRRPIRRVPRGNSGGPRTSESRPPSTPCHVSCRRSGRQRAPPSAQLRCGTRRRCPTCPSAGSADSRTRAARCGRRTRWSRRRASSRSGCVGWLLLLGRCAVVMVGPRGN
jgi:hypothetical protein